ncbi:MULTISPECIES: AzlC family ABC transporter permease [unclassified Enterococcus]|uniref:AzlC family ABC transporter permease n=1 Tax=unclassified Enterococcus TaxID=2608891 RepID=UPI0015519F00|nr:MULTISPECIES: AzlC family ABC transporter permease [unclassified Enterococcus]MBS7577040.1 AzlC family ABC transporter permease [Enterococcus sp. MMGLQ5-2]MBS7584513.1 AzlC family ABC transporter permease [Enterococcus sp. MMGLQ5-1]NPD12368.1 branched-chain amino acid transporter AzlC [Enterococcus sp. MMGLQ5-1]NPD36874.1 branched-chain amino acid transporter AzlC [Enterococcus sp. MMGLQ5-2]
MENAKNQKSEIKAAFLAAFPDTIPILTGFLGLGMAFGILMQTKGYGPIWSVLMSAIAFCGSMQFVAITLLTTTFNPIQAFLLSLMVNARHLFYGISMLNKYKGIGKMRFFLIFTLCDETFSLVSSLEPPKQVNRKYYYFAISFLDYLYWIIGSLLGGIFGGLISFNTDGLDFILTALFVVLFLEQWKTRNNRIPAIIGLMATIISRLIFGASNLVIPAMIIIILALIGGRKRHVLN